MKKIRIIKKGNVRSDSFDIRITESDGKEYYYHFLKLENRNVVIYSPRLYRLNVSTSISWEELPIEVKESHYKELYPENNLTSYEKECFLYGKYEADKMREEEIKEKMSFKGAVFTLPMPFDLNIQGYDKISMNEEMEDINLNK